VIMAALLLYFVLIRKTPYCENRGFSGDTDNAHTSQCDYEGAGFSFLKTCRACPTNAFCHGAEMVSSNPNDAGGSMRSLKVQLHGEMNRALILAVSCANVN
jgi:hypothetical protein